MSAPTFPAKGKRQIANCLGRKAGQRRYKKRKIFKSIVTTFTHKFWSPNIS